MLPLIKIRLIKIKRNPFKTIFTYLFSPIVLSIPLIFFYIIGLNLEKNKRFSKVHQKEYVLFNNSTRQFHSIETAYVICENENMKDAFIAFFDSTCSLVIQCSIKGFSSEKEFRQFQNTSSFNSSAFLFWIKDANKNNITFDLYSNKFDTIDISDSSNLFKCGFFLLFRKE